MDFKELGFSDKEANIFEKEGITAEEVKEIMDEHNPEADEISDEDLEAAGEFYDKLVKEFKKSKKTKAADKTEGKKFFPSTGAEGKMIFWKIVDNNKDTVANVKKLMKEQGYGNIKEEKRNDGKIMLTSEKIVRKEEAEGLTIDPTDGIHQDRDIKAYDPKKPIRDNLKKESTESLKKRYDEIKDETDINYRNEKAVIEKLLKERKEKAGKKVKAVFYHWGDFFREEEFDLDDLKGMERLSEDDLMGSDIRPGDEDRVFFTEPVDIDREEREGESGVGIKRMYGFKEEDLPDNVADIISKKKTKADIRFEDIKEGDRVKFELKDTPLEDFVDVTTEPGEEQDELLKHYDGMIGKVKTIIGDPNEALYLTVVMEDGGILKDVSFYNFVKAAERSWEQVDTKEELPENASTYKYMTEDEEWHETTSLDEVPEDLELYQYEITAAQIEAKRIEAKNRNLAYSMELVEHLPKKYNQFERVFNTSKGTITWVRGDMVIAFTPFWDGFAGIPFEVINGYTNEEIKDGTIEFEKTDNIKVDAAKYLIKFDEIMGEFQKHPRIIAALTADRETEFGLDSFEIKATNEFELDTLKESPDKWGMALGKKKTPKLVLKDDPEAKNIDFELFKDEIVNALKDDMSVDEFEDAKNLNQLLDEFEDVTFVDSVKKAKEWLKNHGVNKDKIKDIFKK